MVIADQSMPTEMLAEMPNELLAEMPNEIVDRLLWRDAQQMLGRHAEPDEDGSCVWCGWRWPCAPRRLAERADAASRRPWREAWTIRHDLNSIRAMPGLRAGHDDRRTPNRGYFD
ncbi:hypothetical protein [Paractinoplanes ovalisporus]|nr:hypothetical protein [Actinoplanes ovalisporus]